MSFLALAVSSGTFLLGGASSWLLAQYLNRRKLADLTTSLNRTRTFLAARNAELADAVEENARLEFENGALKTQNVALMQTFEDLLQPERAGTCSKVQIQSRTDAEAYARKVETATMSGAMTVYKCRTCPRHPVTNDHIFHITHVERAKQGKKWAKPMPAGALRRRVTPQDIAALKARGGAA